MNAILDTNIIYYISEASKCKGLDSKLLISNLKMFDTIAVSDISILEMYTHYRNDLPTLKSIINCLAELQIKVDERLPKKYMIVGKEINQLIKDDSFLSFITKDSLRIKIIIESEFLIFWSISIASLFLATKISINPVTDPVNSKIFMESFIPMVLFIHDENSDFSKEIRGYLQEFYENENESAFKDKIVDFILDLCERFIEMLTVSMSGMSIFDFIRNYETVEKEKKDEIIQKLIDESFLEKITKRKVHKSELVKPEFITYLKSNLQHYVTEMNDLINPAVAQYYVMLFEVFFTHHSKKIEKNCIIDSLLLNYYPKNMLLTYDGDFLKCIKYIDSSYYNQIMSYFDASKEKST